MAAKDNRHLRQQSSKKNGGRADTPAARAHNGTMKGRPLEVQLEVQLEMPQLSKFCPWGNDRQPGSEPRRVGCPQHLGLDF